MYKFIDSTLNQLLSKKILLAVLILQFWYFKRALKQTTLCLFYLFLTAKNMEYVVPSKRIVSKEDLDEFLVSDAYKEYVAYIERLNDSVKNMKIDTDVEVSEVKFVLF